MKSLLILAAMHGDEVYGIELYNAFVLAHPDLSDYIKLVIGNEAAYEKSTRFIDSDLNRHYNSSLTDHESTELDRIEKVISDIGPDYVLDIHTTRRSSGIFYISDELNESRTRLCAMLSFDICVMRDAVIRKSFIGNHDNAISLEYSLDAISTQTTNDFVEAARKLIDDEPSVLDESKIYHADRLITYDEWSKYPGLKNRDLEAEGIALMVPADQSEMDAEYYGFWCTSAHKHN